MFYIGFVSGARVDANGRRYAIGDATLGEHSQRFEANLDHWSTADYERQWREAVLRLAGGPESSALVTSYEGGGDGRHIVLPMWREGSAVYVQPPLVLDGDAEDTGAIYDKIGERGTMSAAAAIAEWQLPLGQLLAFAIDE
jgi:hypothetical protein